MSHLGFTDPWGTSSPAADALLTRSKLRGCLERDVGGGFRVVRIDHPGAALFREAVDVISRGDCGTAETAPDPLLDWTRACDIPSEEHVPCVPLPGAPSATRQAWFHWMGEYHAYFAANRHSLYALVERGKVVAAAYCCPPRTTPYDKSYDEMGINLRKAGMGLAQDILANNRRMRSLGAWQSEHQPPIGSAFFNIVMFATAPEHQGKGCGSVLLRFLGDVADADGAESFLETAGARNAHFYAKGGYKEVARKPLANFTHEGGAVSMRRAPSTKRPVPVAAPSGAAAAERRGHYTTESQRAYKAW